MNKSDEIWNRLKAGDQQALDALFRLYYNDLLQYGQHFYAQTPVIEDKIQGLFLRLWEKQKQLPSPNNILSFLIRSLRNALIDEKRKEQSQQKMIDHLSWINLTKDESEPDKEQKNIKLQQALDQLSEMQREIIFLRFYNQLPYQEIAEVVDMQYQSVRNTTHRAMKILRRCMNA